MDCYYYLKYSDVNENSVILVKGMQISEGTKIIIIYVIYCISISIYLYLYLHLKLYFSCYYSLNHAQIIEGVTSVVKYLSLFPYLSVYLSLSLSLSLSPSLFLFLSVCLSFYLRDTLYPMLLSSPLSLYLLLTTTRSFVCVGVKQNIKEVSTQVLSFKGTFNRSTSVLNNVGMLAI